jgi:hypothetical protein
MKPDRAARTRQAFLFWRATLLLLSFQVFHAQMADADLKHPWQMQGLDWLKLAKAEHNFCHEFRKCAEIGQL